MPKTTKSGSAKPSELPSTLRRSPKKAQRTFAKAHDSAAGEYGDEKRANQVAWAAVKHSFEKVGDHWEKKAGGRKGPSDAQAAGGRNTNRPTKGGVDANATKGHLLELATELFSERGFEAASMDELAQRAGVSKPVIYDQFGSYVFGLAARVIGDRRAAEDVTQDVFLAMWERPGAFDPERGKPMTKIGEGSG